MMHQTSDFKALTEEFETLCKRLYQSYRDAGLGQDDAADRVIDFLARLSEFTETFGVRRWDR